jgi:hypothetical protein
VLLRHFFESFAVIQGKILYDLPENIKRVQQEIKLFFETHTTPDPNSESFSLNRQSIIKLISQIDHGVGQQLIEFIQSVLCLKQNSLYYAMIDPASFKRYIS